MLLSVLKKRCLTIKHMPPISSAYFNHRIRQIFSHITFIFMRNFFAFRLTKWLRLQPILPRFTFDFCDQRCQRNGSDSTPKI